VDRSSKQKINKETIALNDILDQMDLTDIFRLFHPKAAEYISCSSTHRTFSRRDHILGHKSGLNKYKKIEIIPCIFSNHKGMKPQEKNWQDPKYMEIKEHPTKEWKG